MDNETLMNILKFIKNYNAQKLDDYVFTQVINNYLNILLNEPDNELVIKKLRLFLDDLSFNGII